MKQFFFGVVLHPFTVTILSLVLGSFLFFDNIKFADSTIPTLFYGVWSIYAAVVVWVAGAAYLGYSIWNSYFNPNRPK